MPPTPRATTKTPPEPVDEDQADVQDTPPEPGAAEKRVRELERELAKLRAAAAPDAPKEAPPTHVQQLANGDFIETNSPVATHHSTEDGVFPVVAVYPLPPREED